MTECHHAQITALLATFGFSRVLVSSLLSTSVLVPCTLHILAHPKGAATKPNFDTAPNESAFSGERPLYPRAKSFFLLSAMLSKQSLPGHSLFILLSDELGILNHIAFVHGVKRHGERQGNEQPEKAEQAPPDGNRK